MSSSHFHKFTKQYEKYGLGAVKNTQLMVCLLTLARTTNLNKLKDYVHGVLQERQSDPSSSYKRLTRYFCKWSKNKEFCRDLIKGNLELLRNRGCNILLLDGTSWSRGECDYHYLTLSVLYGRDAIPIQWAQLGKIGASSQEERSALLDEALNNFPLKGMTLYADREYVGKKWFKYLDSRGLKFCIRLRINDYYEAASENHQRSYADLYYRCRNQQKTCTRRVTLEGQTYLMVLMPNPKEDAEEEVLIFLTNALKTNPAIKLAQGYVKRWKIECLFRHLKSNGFHLEDINLKDEDKNKLMLTLVATAYILAIRKGLEYQGRIPIKQYSNGTQWAAESIFRRGIAFMTAICYNFAEFITFVLKALKGRKNSVFKNVQ